MTKAAIAFLFFGAVVVVAMAEATVPWPGTSWIMAIPYALFMLLVVLPIFLQQGRAR